MTWTLGQTPSADGNIINACDYAIKSLQSSQQFRTQVKARKGSNSIWIPVEDVLHSWWPQVSVFWNYQIISFHNINRWKFNLVTKPPNSSEDFCSDELEAFLRNEMLFLHWLPVFSALCFDSVTIRRDLL